MRADAIHPIEQALATAIERAFDAKHRKLIRDNAEVPARAISMSAVATTG